MVWQSAGRLPAAKRAMTAGSSSKRDSPVTTTPKAGSRSSSSARESLSAVVRRALRAGDTVPTWLARIPRRPTWNAPPSESRTSASPYQLSSTTVPSGARRSSERWRPADVALVCTTRSQPPAASSGRAKPTPSAAATSARDTSTSTSVTSTPGNRASRRATQLRRPLLDGADVEVAVLDRSREVALLERRAHRRVLARRDAAPEHQSLGAAADAGPQRVDHHVAASRLGQRDRPDLPAPGAAQPERVRLVEHVLCVGYVRHW